MTTYGTIPTTTTTSSSSSSTTTTPLISSDLAFVSLAKERIKSGLGTRRPWMDMFLVPALSLPASASEALHRVGPNIMYYRMNYVIIVLAFVFLGLLWEPTSMIFFICIMFAWLFLYFLRDEPLVVYGYEVNDRVVSLVLSVITLLGLLVTSARSTMFVSLLFGFAAVLAHATFREREDVVIEEDGALPVKQPVPVVASSSSSTSTKK